MHVKSAIVMAGAAAASIASYHGQHSLSEVSSASVSPPGTTRSEPAVPSTTGAPDFNPFGYSVPTEPPAPTSGTHDSGFRVPHELAFVSDHREPGHDHSSTSADPKPHPSSSTPKPTPTADVPGSVVQLPGEKHRGRAEEALGGPLGPLLPLPDRLHGHWRRYSTANSTTVTEIVTALTTYCPEPTVLTHNNVLYTVTEASTLTIVDCPCTLTKIVDPPAQNANVTGPGSSRSFFTAPPSGGPATLAAPATTLAADPADPTSVGTAVPPPPPKSPSPTAPYSISAAGRAGTGVAGLLVAAVVAAVVAL